MRRKNSKNRKLSFGKRIPTPEKHTTERVKLRYEDIKSTPKKFKMVHFIFIGIFFVGVGGLSIVNLVNWREHKPTDHYLVK